MIPVAYYHPQCGYFCQDCGMKYFLKFMETTRVFTYQSLLDDDWCQECCQSIRHKQGYTIVSEVI